MADTALLRKTYDHIAALQWEYRGEDENGNRWCQRQWITPPGGEVHMSWARADRNVPFRLLHSHQDGENPMCGTGLCFAGWLCALSGDYIGQVKGIAYSGPAPGPALGTVLLPLRARQLADLTSFQSASLFFGGNSLGKLDHIITQIEQGEL
jgi:hypothetical protein